MCNRQGCSPMSFYRPAMAWGAVLIEPVAAVLLPTTPIPITLTHVTYSNQPPCSAAP